MNHVSNARTRAAVNAMDEVPQDLVDDARDIERDMVDYVSTAKINLEKADRRAEQIKMALDSDLFTEFDMEKVFRIRELRHGMRVKHKMVSRLLELAHGYADDCDEFQTIIDVAEQLQQLDKKPHALADMKKSLGKLVDVCEQCKIICTQVREWQLDIETLFAELRK
jgi:hypothetical protein